MRFYIAPPWTKDPNSFESAFEIHKKKALKKWCRWAHECGRKTDFCQQNMASNRHKILALIQLFIFHDTFIHVFTQFPQFFFQVQFCDYFYSIIFQLRKEKVSNWFYPIIILTHIPIHNQINTATNCLLYLDGGDISVFLFSIIFCTILISLRV